ncbi:MAG: tRNA (adenosine(37)-N6)-threonylcarbamoyltransferase complex ATPase subunit type 1 TsaE [Flavobacterium lindanitolerans]|jgi:tRNA threonylcarbamoyladenosine biosynthesis protein TsaE|uniref:tRNA (adenosine(37)-N6)-threonylcarbamoyltransferase complex ATPase subunit type 1 TsaE n=1 Tax=Flavobacterium TaxID=237 RepID=UPI0006FD8F7F|nr:MULTISPECIES: tRNA (adenosine(37)-N6)-threonylcarbamoyltransferase complex ATPase subunit type 1 TsaE [Flavobacterium]MBU7571147.1 tRNA (adenosine(37)-N6)-threonylcarbamoyltransferase complex ATPase subunit type 1 TsaE [Flavobacterium sp.]PZO33014.1 MAG: tRNA (adenosine(37)-N6)-threonylcarbamoyltransferase complex ATPase subunit type 1 TsaE [Flavobacteriaceae bacterium]PZQ78831.1 MAG: tRNA (adenosine(37)-N6)-threonylcarbamoyltransferase complex ATPase subunit type 1 TsaE [Flavobacterium johns
MEIQFTLDEINQVAQKILEQKPYKVILFHGDMGAGKTTMIKALSKALGVSNATSSPTFSLVNEYETDGGEIVYHFDVYRLNNESEAYDMGVDEYLYSGEWCFIEWAEKIPSLIPSEHSIITIKVEKDGKRKLTLK